MNQSPPPTPPTQDDSERSRRRHPPALLSPWQFVLISTTMAIAILAGGLWLLQRWFQEPTVESIAPETNPTEITVKTSEDEFTLSDTATPLTTELLPDIFPGESTSKKPVEVKKIWRYRYNVALLPDWTYSAELQVLIDGIKDLAQAAELPVDEMSVVLIDLNKGAIAHHQPHVPHYPASVAKLFWMVALYGQFQQELLLESDFQKELALMVRRSDNNATSQIIDAITRTSFQATGSREEYEAWYLQRLQLNQFFTQAGYQNLNITQKTYPIPDIAIEEPTGFDLQMRQNPFAPDTPIRNQITAWQAARLMSEIVTGQAIAPEASQQMLQWLERDLSQNWQQPRNYFNPIQDFFGAGLPADAQIYSKAGWTTQGRHEVAYIASADGQQQYILCIFAEQKEYAENPTFFPEVANYTYRNIP
ncbi:serine hydrolase [[Limnothrix rosea] IAM M-220]|uniref:serine hydrolase n=1 Tax=[Limnothrix rosea] IAM M-220 TaxID=454133 RepID=UPI00095C413E|nr:serine hydrolase [[Limnothrix rosea] IAM M-220]OKH17864.1 hypothetical protein NIES208_07635 [[Limnothrix rosea] IAM M-220]